MRFGKILFLAVICALGSCSFLSNDKEFRFDKFEDIPKDEGISTWIPNFMPTDAHQIVLIGNLDLNTIFGTYLSETAINQSTDLTRVNISELSAEELKKLKHGLQSNIEQSQVYCSKFEEEVVIVEPSLMKVTFFSDKFIESGFCNHRPNLH